jgi:serine/arginine repetitive matrix protein 2
MEEDDDNFLDGVIEFGDGRQYTVQPAPVPSRSRSTSRSRSRHREGGRASPGGRLGGVPNVPVSKEERFQDDFDRSWPPKPSPSISQREFPPGGHHISPISPVTSQPGHSPQESSRVLFNERSNKLEPYSSAQFLHRPPQAPYNQKKGAHPDPSSSPTESRHSRDLSQHSQQQGVQVLQKPDQSSRPGGFSGSEPNTNDRWIRDGPRRDDPHFSPPSHASNFDHKRQHVQFGPPASSSGHRERDSNVGHRGTRFSNMGPPPIVSPRMHPKDAGRQAPPHLSQAPAPAPSTQKRPPPLDSHALPKEPSLPSGLPSAPLTQSPLLSQVVVVSPAQDAPLLSAISDLDMDEVRKDLMQSAAARAKERRKLEEEEREKERERARKKALELEERQKAADAEKSKANQSEVCLYQCGCSSWLH